MVVLVDDGNIVLGLASKDEVHTDRTPLHRGFSVFIFDSEGRLLLQQRSADKVTWPLEWSNSCCGHPGPEESAESAARRRLGHELGLTDVELDVVLPDFRYRAEREGIVENEICPVLVGVTAQQPVPNHDEVAGIRWVGWPSFVASIREDRAKFSPWCVEETILLAERTDLPEILERLRRAAVPG